MVYAYFLHSSSSSWIEQKTKNQKNQRISLPILHTLKRIFTETVSGRKEGV
jgi:hypothetical protein